MQPKLLSVPIEYAGKWFAWDHAMTRIIASGESPAAVLETANELGIYDPILDKSPRAGVRMIGGPRRIERGATSTEIAEQ